MKVLEEQHAHAVMIIILENPGILRSKLYESVIGASRPTAQKRVDQMIEAELIRAEKSKTHSKGQHLFLTEEGTRIAKLLKMIESGEDPSSDVQTDYGTHATNRNTVKG